jgi:acetylornithine deacetylase
VLTPVERTVLDAVDERRLREELAALLRFPSLGGDEDAAQAHMASRLAALGAEVDAWEIDVTALAAHPSFSMEVPRRRGAGVVGTLAGHGDGPTLVFNGHVDVVPVGDPARWSVPPFDCTERDGLIYGRGACDMKGGLACALAALAAVRASGVRWRGRLALHSVIAEEDGGAGTLATLQRGHSGDGAISMEPTQLAVAPAHAGALGFRLRVPGRATHGCVREEGVSALETFEPIHHALLALERTRNVRLAQPLFADYRLPYALSIGKVTAGDWPSSVPDLLVAEGRYGLAPGERADVAVGEFERAVGDAADAHPFLRAHRPVVEWWGGRFLPASTPEDAAVVRAAASAASDVTGVPARLAGMTYGADMRLLVNDGGIPTVLFGPGDVRRAHGPDECVPVHDLVVVARALALAAVRFCGVAP